MGTHFYTSITLNFLPKARVLAQSIRKFHPHATIHLVLCDKPPSWLSMKSEPFDHLIRLDEVGAPDLNSWLFGHDQVELCTAVKGFALQSILARSDCETVIYLDPDIVLLAPLDGLLKNFEQSSILLTPHQTVPEDSDEAVRDHELRTLQHGIFNLGFLGVKTSPEGHRFANWWAERLRDFCWDDIPKGLFTDQRWPDLVSAFFPDHLVLREPVYNVAGWNLTHRRVEGSLEQGLTVNGEPLVFYHFSGIDSGRELSMLQRYGSDMPALFELRQWYLEECERNGASELGSASWAYGFFANGKPILKTQRRQYREDPHIRADFPDPFETYDLTPRIEPEPEPVKVSAYRIFLIAAPADAIYVDETLQLLQQNTAAKEKIWLIANNLDRDVPSISVDANRYEDFAAHILEQFKEQDIILIRAGALPPPFWDLRLGWTAARHASALTVSPLDRRVLDPVALSAGLETEEVDRLSYFYRQNASRELPAFGQDCVYLKSAGLRELGRVRPGLRLTHLTDDAARLRWQHLEATDICVSFRCPQSTRYLPKADRAFSDKLRSYSSRRPSNFPSSISSTFVGTTLHVTHNLGGGVEHWIRTYSEADAGHENLVLRSLNQELQLYRYGAGEPQLLESYALSSAIATTALAHNDYRTALAKMRERFKVGRVIVSSLIGHSLDCLKSGLPTLFVAHDYYPYCSAINIHFGGTCQSCEAPRLEACLEENPLNRFFPNVKSEWLDLRAEFIQTLTKHDIPLIAPTPSVKTNYGRLAPELAGSIRVIPHGVRSFNRGSAVTSEPIAGRLRVVILGNFELQKGATLLTSLLPEVLSFAQITLVGCSAAGTLFAAHPGVQVIPEYRPQDLPDILHKLRPDVGLLLSIWPETFSFTLRELQDMGIPPLATNLGAFADAIDEGVTGFLSEPDPLSLAAILRRLASEPAEIARVRANLKTLKHRSPQAMVKEYSALMPEVISAEQYFSGPRPIELMEQALQLYWRGEGAPFLPANSFVYAPEHRGRQSARLHIPPVPNGIAQLRLDLGSAPGIVSLFRIALCTQSGTAIWRFRDIRAILQGASHQQIHPLDSTTACLSGDDPHVNLRIPGYVLLQLSAGGHMEIEFSWKSLTDGVQQMTSAIEAYAGAKAEVIEVSDRYEELVKGLNLQIANADRSLRELMKERDRIAEEAHSLAVATPVLNTRIEALEKEAEQLQRELETVRREKADELTSLHGAFNTALEQSGERHKEQLAQLAYKDQVLALSQTHIRNIESLNRAMLSSVSWQLTRPIRVLSRLSRKLTGSGKGS